MKELIIGFNDNTKELANLIRKDISIDYISYSEYKRFILSNKYLCGLAFIVVDYKKRKEVELASGLVRCLKEMYSMSIITIACNTTRVEDDLYYYSTAITYIENVNTLYDDNIIRIINTINAIIDESNYIKLGIKDMSYAAEENREFRLITASSSDGFIDLEKEIGESKNFILYVEANDLFEPYDLDSTFELLHLKHKDETCVIYCSRKLPNEIESINVNILAFK